MRKELLMQCLITLAFGLTVASFGARSLRLLLLVCMLLVHLGRSLTVAGVRFERSVCLRVEADPVFMAAPGAL